MGLVWGICRVKLGLGRVFDRWGLGIKGTMGNGLEVPKWAYAYGLFPGSGNGIRHPWKKNTKKEG